MRSIALVCRGSLLCSTVALLVGVQIPSQSKANDSFVVMTASADTFTFSPDRVVAHVGKQASIQLTSSEGIHGIASSELGIETTLVRPGHSVTVAFTPKTPGEYVVHCASVCGIGHKGMAFRVTVER